MTIVDALRLRGEQNIPAGLPLMRLFNLGFGLQNIVPPLPVTAPVDHLVFILQRNYCRVYLYIIDINFVQCLSMYLLDIYYNKFLYINLTILNLPNIYNKKLIDKYLIILAFIGSLNFPFMV